MPVVHLLAVLAKDIKGAICENVAKIGNYTQIQNTAASQIRLPLHPLPSRLEVTRAYTQFCSLSKDQDVLLFMVTLAVD